MPNEHQIGHKIRMARKQKGLTLGGVAARTQLSIGFLSQVERHIARPSLASLASIAAALDIPLSTLLSTGRGTGNEVPISLSRDADRRAMANPLAGSTVERLSPLLPGYQLRPVKIRLAAWLTTRPESHDGEEFIFVLAGSVRCVIDSQPYELQQGDSIRFASQRTHWFQNLSDSTVEMLSVATTQQFRREDLDHIVRSRTAS